MEFIRKVCGENEMTAYLSIPVPRLAPLFGSCWIREMPAAERFYPAIYRQRFAAVRSMKKCLTFTWFHAYRSCKRTSYILQLLHHLFLTKEV